MTAEIWGALGLALLGAITWLVRMVRRADRDRRDLKDARDYQKSMEAMTDAHMPVDAAAARRGLRDRPANQR